MAEEHTEKKPTAQMVLKSKLETMKPAIAQIIPSNAISADRLIKVVLSCTARTPSLLDCDMGTILMAVQQAAELGLEIGGGMQEAYLVPFKNKKNGGRLEVQCIVGYQGMIKLIRNTGELQSLTVEVVFRGEPFRVNLGEGTVFHERDYACEDARSPNDVIAAYCIFRYKDGGRQVTVMSRSELDSVRKSSKAQGEWSPWSTNTIEMFKKTAIRRGFKLAPKSTQKLSRAMEILQDTEEVEFGRIGEAPEEKVALKDRLKARAQSARSAEEPMVTEGEIVDDVTGEVYVPPVKDSEEWADGRM